FDTGTFTITVNRVAPTASIAGAPASVPEGTPVTLNAVVTDPSPVDMAAGFGYAWSVTKNGSPFTLPPGTVTNAAGFAFTPMDDGTYVVTLTATDEDGLASVPVMRTITVTEVNPTISITGVPSNPVEGTPIPLGSSLTDLGVTTTASSFFNYA